MVPDSHKKRQIYYITPLLVRLRVNAIDTLDLVLKLWTKVQLYVSPPGLISLKMAHIIQEWLSENFHRPITLTDI